MWNGVSLMFADIWGKQPNLALGICALLFAVLGVSELVKAIAKATAAASGG